MTLSEAIHAHKLTPCKLASMAGLTPKSIYNLLNGAVYPSLDTAAKIASVLPCEIVYERMTAGVIEAVKCSAAHAKPAQ